MSSLSTDIGPDTPLRLHVAARLAYPDGSMTASGLRSEARKGRLDIERTANKLYTTLRAIQEMRGKCRDEAKARACGLNQPAGTAEETSRTIRSGSSATEAASKALAAAKAKLKLHRLPSPTTSSAKPKRRASATVIQLNALLPT